jgi:hypothetical protein
VENCVSIEKVKVVINLNLKTCGNYFLYYTFKDDKRKTRDLSQACNKRYYLQISLLLVKTNSSFFYHLKDKLTKVNITTPLYLDGHSELFFKNRIYDMLVLFFFTSLNLNFDNICMHTIYLI